MYAEWGSWVCVAVAGGTVLQSRREMLAKWLHRQDFVDIRESMRRQVDKVGCEGRGQQCDLGEAVGECSERVVPQ